MSTVKRSWMRIELKKKKKKKKRWAVGGELVKASNWLGIFQLLVLASVT